MPSMTPEQRFLEACHRRPVDATPVWFMRQAGRCLPAYRRLREQYDILTLAKTPELCAEVTMLPVDVFGVDGAVLFADIILPLEPMGIELTIDPGVGPVIANPVRTMADVERLVVMDDGEEAVPFVMEALRLTRRELRDGRAALIGFAAAPFTLACYLVEGRASRDYARVRTMLYSAPDVWQALMERVTAVTERYLDAQIRAGAQVVQLFDSWVGMLAPDDYERSVLPYSTRIFQSLAAHGVPRIHFGTGTASLLELMASAGCDIVSVDWRVRLDEAWARIGHDLGIQGNLDPVLLLSPYERVEAGVHDVLRRAGGRPGHVFNLGHGVLPDTDPATLTRVVEEVHRATARGS